MDLTFRDSEAMSTKQPAASLPTYTMIQLLTSRTNILPTKRHFYIVRLLTTISDLDILTGVAYIDSLMSG